MNNFGGDDMDIIQAEESNVTDSDLYKFSTEELK